MLDGKERSFNSNNNKIKLAGKHKTSTFPLFSFDIFSISNGQETYALLKIAHLAIHVEQYITRSSISWLVRAIKNECQDRCT